MTRTVHVTSQQAPGNYITGALWNAGPKALGDFTLALPVFAGYQATVQSVPNGTTASLSIDTSTFDSDGGHSNTTNNSRYTGTVPGTYLILGFAAYAANATGVRSVRVAKNGTSVPGTQTTLPTSSTIWAAGCWAVVALNGSTDYVEITSSQTSGGALNTYNGSDAASAMAVYWLSS
jgi:hypothetical protein